MISYYKGEINWKQFDRKNSIHRIYKIESIPKEYWFPNR